ncbi:MAG TPA: hypothetical protein PLX69_23350 [Leptospiraceae bacterium]|nr:hypothetical protein [Leptospiraceae bacterium]HRG77516.1 hypothetical protein [Leptospiraceae bacterium]
MDKGFYMLSNIEVEILVGAVGQARAEGEFLSAKSSSIAYKESKEVYSWKDIHSTHFPVSQDLYDDWILKNKEPISFTDISEQIKMKSISDAEFGVLSETTEKKWSILYSFTRPGISDNGNFALVQITAFCPSGPPNYGSIYLLEKSGTGWTVKYNYGLYNQ